MTYDATTHRLTRVTNALSQNTNFAYGTHGRLTSITHPDSTVWSWTALETVGLPTGTSGNAIARANPTGSGRDGQGIPGTFRTDRFGLVSQWIDPLSHSTLTQRNADGLPVRVTQADPDGTSGPLTSPITLLGYSSVGDLVYQQNPDGNATTWTYTTSLHQVATATDELNRTTSYSYDSAGNVTSITDPAGKSTTYTYNSHGLPTSITTPDPDGTGPLSAAVTSFAYDSYGRLTTQTNPDSSTRTYAYNSADQITSDTDELAHAASFTYDALGRLTSQTDRSGAETSYVYNAVNLLAQETDALDHVTDYTYNSRGWLTRTDLPDPDGSGPLDRPYSVRGYDSVGHLTSLGEPTNLGAPYQFSYDTAGRRTGVRHQGDTSGTTYTYDNLNRVIKVVNPELYTASTYYSYNWRGQVTEVSQIYDLGGAPTLTTAYEYDPAGQLITEVDPRGYSTKYVYDARGLLSTLWLPDPDGDDPNTTGPEFRSWEKSTYDDVGRLIRTEDVLGRHTDYVYNNRDWMTQTTLPDPDGDGALGSPVTSATYDAAGRTLSTTDPLGNVTSATYDNLGRILSVTGEDPDDSGPLSAPVESRTYDALGNLLTRDRCRWPCDQLAI